MPSYGNDPTPKQASVVILDMGAVIHMWPTHAKVVGEYTSMHLLPFMESQEMPRTTRIDAVWDCSHKHSLKNQTRTKRQAGGGIQGTWVSTKIPIPRGKDWQQFLSINQNKDVLFKYLSTQLISATTNNTACCMCLSPTDHEEADSRMMLHLQHAVMAGHKVAFVRTVDSDVVVLSIHHYPTFQNLDLTGLWIGFGCGKNYKDTPVHEVSAQLGPNRCLALPFFHAFPGSDLTSRQFGIRKKLHGMHGCIVQKWQKPWSPWCINLKKWLRTLFICVALNDWQWKCTTKTAHVPLLMRHGRCCSLTTWETWSASHPLKLLIYQYVKRGVFVCVFIWHLALARELRLPAPAAYGWEFTRTEAWVHYWTHLENASIACSLLLHCPCSKAYKGRCKCCKGWLRCTPLCKCQGGCCNNQEWNRWSVFHINKDFETVNEPIYPHMKCILGI